MKLCRTSQAGYTLIELLVAILLLGFIGVALAGGLHFGARVWESADNRLTTTGTIKNAQFLLRELLSNALPKEKAGLVIFEGTEDHIRFVAPAPQAFPVGGPVTADLVGEGADLTLRLASPIDKDAVRQAILVRGLGPLRFSYLDASEKLPLWLSLWRDRTRLPDAIRIENKESTWPSLIVRPQIDESHPCVFDPISMVCRES